MSLIPQKLWSHLEKLKKCPKCGSGNFDISIVQELKLIYLNGRLKEKKVSSGTDSQNFQCSECDLNIDEMGFEV